MPIEPDNSGNFNPYEAIVENDDYRSTPSTEYVSPAAVGCVVAISLLLLCIIALAAIPAAIGQVMVVILGFVILIPLAFGWAAI